MQSLPEPPTLYFIFYGNWGAGDIGLLETFAQGLSNSTWMGMTTYSAGMATSFTYGGSTTSQASLGTSLSDGDIAQPVLTAAAGSVALRPACVHANIRVGALVSAICWDGWRAKQIRVRFPSSHAELCPGVFV